MRIDHHSPACPGSELMALTVDELRLVNAYWRAANYLSVGQIYLLDNPLLREPLLAEHIKPRLLGHWGTTPGLNLLYAHLNRRSDCGGSTRCWSWVLATADQASSPTPTSKARTPSATPRSRRTSMASDGCSASSRSRVASRATQHRKHPDRCTRVASWATPSRMRTARRSTTPDSLSAASSVTAKQKRGRSPRAGTRTSLSVPSTTVPCCRSCTSTGTRSPTPPCSPGSQIASSCRFSRGTAITSTSSRATFPRSCIRLAATMDSVFQEIQAIQHAARSGSRDARPRWPMIVLRTPKGWTGPAVVDGVQVEGTFRAHQVPISDPRTNRGHLELLDDWLRSYRPEELFTPDGAPEPELSALAPTGDRRMSANPRANGGCLLSDLRLPDFRPYGVSCPEPGSGSTRGDPCARCLAARRHRPRTRRASGSSDRMRPRQTGCSASSR